MSVVKCYGLSDVSKKEIEELMKLKLTDEKYKEKNEAVLNTYKAQTERMRVEAEALDRDERRRIDEAELKDRKEQRKLEYVKVAAEVGTKIVGTIVLGAVFGNIFGAEEVGALTTKALTPALSWAKTLYKI